MHLECLLARLRAQTAAATATAVDEIALTDYYTFRRRYCVNKPSLRTQRNRYMANVPRWVHKPTLAIATFSWSSCLHSSFGHFSIESAGVESGESIEFPDKNRKMVDGAMKKSFERKFWVGVWKSFREFKPSKCFLQLFCETIFFPSLARKFYTKFKTFYSIFNFPSTLFPYLNH